MWTRYTVLPLAHPYLPPVPLARGREIAVLYILATPIPARDSPELRAYSEPVYFGPSGRLSPITSARAENDFKVFIWISDKIILPPARSMGELKNGCRSRRKKGKQEETPRCRGVPFCFRVYLLLSGGAVPLAGELLLKARDILFHFVNDGPRGVEISGRKRLDRALQFAP